MAWDDAVLERGVVLFELRAVVPNARNVNLKASRPLPTPSLPAQRSLGRPEDLASTRLAALLVSLQRHTQGSIAASTRHTWGGNRSFRPRTHLSAA